MLSLADVRNRLKDRPARVLEPQDHARAAVALVLYGRSAGLDVLFIERSQHEHDPWSGHVGFPGGRVEPGDPGPREAAERETREEIGLDLIEAEYLGRLDDLLAVHVPLVVSCFVFGTKSLPALVPNPAEVKEAFWFPLAGLADPTRRGERTFPFRGELLIYPAVQVLGEGRPWLWGITYRLVAQFLGAVREPA